MMPLHIHIYTLYTLYTHIYTKDVWQWKSYCPKIITQNPLNFLGNLHITTSDVIQEAKQFVAKCYGVNHCFTWKEPVVATTR